MTAAHELADGVYVRLPTDSYFAQRRLGSTDMAKLLRGAADWWYQSANNPDIDPSDGSDERDFGHALHTLILEGEEAYLAGVVIRPALYPGVNDKTGFREMKKWNGNAIYCREWERKHADGRAIVPEKWGLRVRHMAGLILNHPQYAEPLRSGLPEVSVLFQLDGQPMRARIDYLLPKFLIDLKSYGGHVRGDGPLDKALRIVAEKDYDVQRYVYDRAREAMIGLINAGQVHGATAAELAWLQRLALETDWAWVWIFYQRRDDRLGRAPVVLPILRRRFDVTFETGRVKFEKALANYRKYVSRFGLDVPWADIQPMREPPDHAFPPWLTFQDHDIPEETV